MRMMLADGLYKRFPKPDYALALHSDPHNPAGVASYAEGLALAASDTVDILVKGKGATAQRRTWGSTRSFSQRGSSSTSRPLSAAK